MAFDGPGGTSNVRPLFVILVRKMFMWSRAQEDFLDQGTRFEHLLSDLEASSQQLQTLLSLRNQRPCCDSGISSGCDAILTVIKWHLANALEMDGIQTKMRASALDYRIAGSGIPAQLRQLAQTLDIDMDTLGDEKDPELLDASWDSDRTIGNDCYGMDWTLDSQNQWDSALAESLPVDTVDSACTMGWTCPAPSQLAFEVDRYPCWLYQPLLGMEFRLVTIEGAADEDVQCQLTTWPMSSDTSYTALSYTWGNIEDTVPISVNGAHVKVTRNLAVALRRLRQENLGYLWVDALCINQEDDAEKSQQVRLMGDIYSKAARVVAWLGDPTPKSELALGWLGSRDAKTLVLDGSGLDDSFHELLASSWFQRVWTLQEAYVARTFTFLCGNRSFSRMDLIAAPVFRDIAAEVPGTIMNNIWRSLCGGVVDVKAVRRHMRLQDALAMSCYQDCSDPRDKVYAWMAMQPKALTTPYPNYQQSYDQVCIDASAWIIGQQGLTACVTLASRTSTRASRLPSWTVDWARVGKQMPPWIFEAVDSPCEASVLPQFVSPSALRITGVLLETIEHVFRMSDEQELEGFHQGLKARRNGSIDSATLAQGLWSAVVSSQKHTDTRCSSRAINSCKAWPNSSPPLNCCGLGDYECGRRSHDWMVSNGDTMFGERTLSDLVSEYRSSRAKPCPPTSTSHSHDCGASVFEDALRSMESYGMRVVMGASNDFRIAYKAAQVGDQVYRLQGCPLPLLLRRTERGYRLVGELLMADRGGDDAQHAMVDSAATDRGDSKHVVLDIY